MFFISSFTDEISQDLQQQINFLKKNNLTYMELRGVWDKNVLDLSDDELNKVKSELDKNELKVSSVASPIGKVDIDTDFNEYIKTFNRAIEIAKKMETKYIRLFSFYDKTNNHRFSKDEVIHRLKAMSEIAKENNILLVHENEADIYGESSKSCLELAKEVDNDNFKAAFDFANYVIAGEDTLNTSYPLMKDHIEYIHVKDALLETKGMVVAGTGNGHISEILDMLRDKENLVVSLEPHLVNAGQFQGFSGEVLFQKNLDAFKALLDNLNIEYI